MKLRSFAISVCAVAAMTAGLFARGGALPAGGSRIISVLQEPDTLAAENVDAVSEPKGEATPQADSVVVAEPAAEAEVQADTTDAAPEAAYPRVAERPRMQRRTEPADGADTAVIFMKADWVTRRQIDTARVTCFVGNFAAHHNGTIITADSAIRYSDSYVECFGNVLINKNTTYIYGDRADYDSEMEIANVYSPIVKMVDGDAVLYSYNFSFDTHDNVGTFYGGGTVTNRENKLESDRGCYYADYHEVICVERVEVDSETYEMKGDSVIYNLDTDNAYYFDRSNIWNDKGEYLYADRGEYQRDGDLYKVTMNGYILTEKQEVWSDSIDYWRDVEHAILRRNIQIDDTEHKTLGFGDYGEYWGDIERALLTSRPSVVNYDTEQGDTLYMRSDSMFLYTVEVLPDGKEHVKGERVQAQPEQSEQPETDGGAEDSVVTDSLPDNGPANEDSRLASPRRQRAADAAEPDDERPAAEGSASRRLSRRISSDDEDAGAAGAVNRLSTDEERTADDAKESTTDEAGDDAAATPRSKNTENKRGEGVGPQRSENRNAELPAADSLVVSADSVTVDSLAADSLSHELTAAELKARMKEEAAKLKAEKKAASAKARKEKLDRIAALRLQKLQKQKAKDEAAAAVRKAKADALRRKQLERENAKRAKKGLPPIEDTLGLHNDIVVNQDSTYISPDVPADSLETENPAADSLNRDSLSTDSLLRDSTYRRVHCFRDVRIYRSDFQALCDSLVAFTSDSTAHLYIRPVLWNGNNQVTSEVMDIFTAKQMITQADFVGHPMMIAELDTINYNQVSGKTMTALFDEHGQIYRNDVNGNVETVYYIQDSGSGEITDAMYLKSGEATYFIVDQQVETITYRTDADGQLSPMDMLPDDQITRLQGFEWRGAERPEREDVFNREIRLSQRDRVMKLQRPRFPITQAIESLRQRLVERREWLDRVDILSPEDEEWRRETLEKPYK